ncbi:MATE family efflux transporter [Roseovarius sp. SCSIO 43702]|nr:MATE family efflux transporter [Roseovarius sp. SCSIO 43702]
MASDQDLNSGSVGRALVRVSAPMTLGILGVLSVGLADAFFLARHGDASLAAIGFIFPVTTALTSLSIGLSAGTSAVLSRSIGGGAKDDEQARMTLHAMLLGAILSVIVAVFFYFVAGWLFGLMGADGKVLDAAVGYVPYWCASFPVLVVGMSLNSVFRAGGRSEVAAIAMLAQSVVNIGLDPVMIFGWGPLPEQGTAGAGLATLIARGLSFVGVCIFAIRVRALRLDCSPMRDITSSFQAIGKVGAPAALSNAINPAGMAIITAAVATISDAAVAGFGAAGRIQAFVIIPMLALSSGIGPVVGQAWGAEKTGRARAAVRLTFVVCVIYSLAVAALLLIIADPVATLMTAGDGAKDFTASYLRIASWGFFGYGVLITANAAMNARDRALWSMTLSASRIFLIYVPAAWAGVMVFGYTGILAATVTANAIAAWAAIVACRSVGLLDEQWAIVETPARWIAQRSRQA